MAMQHFNSRINPQILKGSGMSEEEDDQDCPGEVSDEYQDVSKNQPEILTEG